MQAVKQKLLKSNSLGGPALKSIWLIPVLLFLSADIAVVEMSDAFRQPSLFYHLGVRESFSMANNIILYCDTNVDSLQSLKVDLKLKDR